MDFGTLDKSLLEYSTSSIRFFFAIISSKFFDELGDTGRGLVLVEMFGDTVGLKLSVVKGTGIDFSKV